MNTLLQLWPGATLGSRPWAILNTPMYRARYYYGPVLSTGQNQWVPADNATSRYHATLQEAVNAATESGVDTTGTAALLVQGQLDALNLRLAALREPGALAAHCAENISPEEMHEFLDVLETTNKWLRPSVKFS